MAIVSLFHGHCLAVGLYAIILCTWSDLNVPFTCSGELEVHGKFMSVFRRELRMALVILIVMPVQSKFSEAFMSILHKYNNKWFSFHVMMDEK
jgi:hypothetical protein